MKSLKRCKMRFNKKAAMELGISTVVMLVIAIVIIGGGIAFIRGFFGKGTDSLTGAFEVADFGLEPTAQKPLVLTDGRVRIKTGATGVVRVGFYNRGTQVLNNAQANITQCVTTVSGACDNDDLAAKPTMVSLGQKVEIGQVAGFQTQVIAQCQGPNPADLPAGTYTCNLVIQNDDEIAETTQIIFEVTS